ncbi:TetR/AcrR family transcriptional regulator [Luminiphilus sp.]|nr:TetR/AcrR family transcriptional regulator [Luminiphilus sp.]
MKRTRLSPEARQEHLLDCSAEIIVMESVSYFTMEGLAKCAGVSAPLIYNYFPNRIVLLQTLLKREYRRFSDRTFEAAKEANTFLKTLFVFRSKAILSTTLQGRFCPCSLPNRRSQALLATNWRATLGLAQPNSSTKWLSITNSMKIEPA